MLLFDVIGKLWKKDWKGAWQITKDYPPDFWERLKGIFDDDKTPAKSIEDIDNELKKLILTNSNINDVYELSTRSLEEAKKLTEYEDDKANRILTAIAFISAFAGALFAALISKRSVAILFLSYTHSRAALLCDYFFTVFVFAIFGGAFLVLTAIRPRFNIPKENNKPLKSYLFFDPILKAGPIKWADGFTAKLSQNDLKLEYIKCNILETYLVADKIRQKLKALKPGIELLRLAIMALAGWFAFFLWIFLTSDLPDANSASKQPPKKVSFTNSTSQIVKPKAITPQRTVKKRHPHETQIQQRYSAAKCCCCN